MQQLIRNAGSTAEEVFPLKEGSTSIGRARENDIVILDSSLSRQHARLDQSEEQFTLVDLESRNGTYVNGVKVETCALKHGDMIQCGDVVLAFYTSRRTPEDTTPGERSRIALRDLLLQDRESSRRSALRLKNEDVAARARDKFHILLRVGELLSSPEDIDTLLERILDLLFEIVQAKRAIILLINEKTGQLEPRIVKPPQENGSTQQLYSSHIVEHVLEKQVGIVSSDTQADLRFSAAESIMQQAIRSSLCVPLKVRDQLIGVMYVDNSSLIVKFGDEELEFVAGFANQAAIAIENSRLYKKLEEQARNREKELVALVEERTRDLVRASAEAEEANHAKSRFLASMSHELRTPLNAIIGYSEMLQEEMQDLGEGAFNPDLKKIQVAGKHLLVLINDILDLTKIEAGKMDLYLETFSLSALIQDVATTIAPLVGKNGNRLELRPADGLGKVYGDATRVRQILFNLLSNASKFTKDGVITLEADRLLLDGNDWIQLVVRDTGIGMTPEQMGKLFKAFSQADTMISKKFGGTGLGLALSKRFCQMMGGEITAESEYGTGSAFTVRIPAEVTSTE
jgi:signal transduction histidine kinase/pSer/pThr/pTyr-binding forkhead associated (FHA) protein